MQKILIRTALIALVLVQVVSIILIIDQKKTAKAQCIPTGAVSCNAPFIIDAATSAGVPGYVTVACSGGVIASTTWVQK